MSEHPDKKAKKTRQLSYLWQTNCRIRLTNALTEQPILMGIGTLNTIYTSWYLFINFSIILVMF